MKTNWIIEECIFSTPEKYNEFKDIIIKNGDHIDKDYTGPISCLSSLSTARDCVKFNEVRNFCETLVKSGVSENELVVVSAGKNLGTVECRFWIIDGKIITASEYAWGDLLDISEPPKICYDYVNSIIDKINIPAYTIDICICDSFFKVVEINNIYTSGTYNCDLEKLYIGLRDMAVKEYRELL